MNTISINTTNDSVSTTVTIAGKEFADVPVEMLNLSPQWQRSLNTAKAKRKIAQLVEKWDDHQCRPITAIYNPRTRKYDVVDGGHRAMAAIIRGIKTLVVEIIRLNGTEKEIEQEAARLFAEQGVATDRLTPAEKHSANLMNNIKANVNLDLAAREAGFAVKQTDIRGKGRMKNFVYGFNEALRFAENCPEALNLAFDVIKTIHWNEENGGLSAEAIHMIGAMFVYHMDQKEKVSESIKNVLENVSPKLAFSSAMADFSGRNMSSRDLLWLEDKVCSDLKIERRYFGGKFSFNPGVGATA